MSMVFSNQLKKHLLDPLASENLYIMAIGNHTIDLTATNMTAVAASEITADGYDPGGVALANKSVIKSDADGKAYLDCDDPVLGDITGSMTSRKFCMYLRTGSNMANNVPYVYIDKLSDQTRVDVEYKLALNAKGILEL